MSEKTPDPKSVRLLKYDAARTALAAAHRVDEVKDIRDKAVAIAAYARQAKDRDMITWATEIKLRAERRTGELLIETEKHPGGGPGRGKKNQSPPATSFSPPKLKDLGISKDQSADWQKVAAIPEREFERRLKAAAGEPATMTTAKILKRRSRRTPPRRPARVSVADRRAELALDCFDAVAVRLRETFVAVGPNEQRYLLGSMRKLLDDLEREARGESAPADDEGPDIRVRQTPPSREPGDAGAVAREA